MDEERVDRLAARLRAVLAADLAPDAAGSTSLAMALLAVMAESEMMGEGAKGRRRLLPARRQAAPTGTGARRGSGLKHPQAGTRPGQT